MIQISCLSTLGRQMLTEAGLFSGISSRRTYLRVKMCFPDADISNYLTSESVLAKVWDMLTRGLGTARAHEIRLEHTPLNVLDGESPIQVERRVDIIRFMTEKEDRAKAVIMEEPDGPSHLVLLEWNPKESSMSTGYMFSKPGHDIISTSYRIKENGVLEPLANDFSLLGKVVKIAEEQVKAEEKPKENDEDDNMTFKEVVF